MHFNEKNLSRNCFEILRTRWLLYVQREIGDIRRANQNAGNIFSESFGWINNNIFHWKLHNFGILFRENVTRPVFLTFIAARAIVDGAIPIVS